MAAQYPLHQRGSRTRQPHDKNHFEVEVEWRQRLPHYEKAERVDEAFRLYREANAATIVHYYRCSGRSDVGAQHGRAARSDSTGRDVPTRKFFAVARWARAAAESS